MVKRLYILLCGFICLLEVFSQSTSAINNYIDQYKTIALEHEKKYGIPATITLAQGILESGAGTSRLAEHANNHFGIKAGVKWNGSVYLAWDDEPQKSRFRKYNSVAESFEDHASLIRSDRYSHLFAHSIYDYRKWAFGLQKAGYATAANYAKALIGYIDAYKLYAINGGVKLRPGKTVTVTKNVKKEQPEFASDCQMSEEEATEEEENIRKATRKIVVEINNVRCTVLYPGESLNSIAIKYNIPKIKLMRYNELQDESDVKEGDVIFLSKKKSKYSGSSDYYRVKGNESLYTISQKFGIKISSLAKMNDISISSKLQEGKRLRLK